MFAARITRKGSLISYVLVCTLSLLWSSKASCQQSPTVDGQSNATTGPQVSPQNTTASITLLSQAPKAHIQVMRLNETGTAAAPVAPFAIAGAHAVYFGGPVIANVHVVQVIYGSGSFVPNVTGAATPTVGQYFTDITQSSLMDLLSEYNTVGVTAADGTAGTNQTIGHGLFDGTFTITPSAANNGSVITDSQIQSELLAQVTAGHLPAPFIDGQGNNNTLYMIYFPAGKSITDGTSSSCVARGFCAYHNSTNGTFSAHRLYYGVFPDVQPPSLCSQGCGGPGLFDIVTNVASHELSEAVTDADVGPANAFARPLAWIDQTNGEIGDICVGQEVSVLANGTNYTVQREFSNLQNDCVASPPKFQISGGLTVNTGQKFDLPLAIQSDSGANLITYAGTVHFTSTDPSAVLPADYTFNFADAGQHTFVVTLNTAGPQSITATDSNAPLFTGSSNYTVTVPGASTFTIAMPGNAAPGVAIPVTVAARTGQFNDLATGYTGTIHFRSGDAAAVLPANTTLLNGTGTFSVTFNTQGFETLVVEDAANPQIFGSTGSNVATPPANPTVTAVAVNNNPATFGQPATYTATVTQNGSPVTTGTVNFNADGQPFSFAAVDAAGHAQVQGSLNGGSHVVFAEYTGGGTASPPSSSTALSVAVNPAPTTTTVSSTLNPSTFGDKVFLTAQISSALGGINGGSVTFTDNGAPLAVISAPFSPVSFGNTSLSVGSHTIVASYSGSTNFASSTSASIVQVVNPAPPLNYAIQTDKNAVTLSAGQAATFLITTQSVSGFNGTVTFSCGNLPAFTTCTFLPASATVSPFVTTVSTRLTVKTSGPHASLLPLQRNGVNALWWTATPFAFGLCLAGVLRGKRRAVLLSCLVLMLALATFMGCGGGGGTPPPPPPPPVTPAGVTTFNVSSASKPISGPNAANPSQQINISLTVLQ